LNDWSTDSGWNRLAKGVRKSHKLRHIICLASPDSVSYELRDREWADGPSSKVSVANWRLRAIGQHFRNCARDYRQLTELV
jgi:hypothetical protein